MDAFFISYCTLQWINIPMWAFMSGLSVLLLGIVACFWIKGLRKVGRYIAGLLLIDFILLVCSSTVFFRPSMEAREYNLTPFWTYSKPEFFMESMMNLVLFLPIGLLLGVAFRTMSWKKALLIGFCLSVGIELMQYVFKKGLAEFDDVMHNTVGCLIGYGIYYALDKIWIKMKA